MKIHRSYRIDETALENLNELVTLYQSNLSKSAGFEIKVSPATVIESLINEKTESLKGAKKK
jgi:hypothetical protein